MTIKMWIGALEAIDTRQGGQGFLICSIELGSRLGLGLLKNSEMYNAALMGNANKAWLESGFERNGKIPVASLPK